MHTNYILIPAISSRFPHNVEDELVGKVKLSLYELHYANVNRSKAPIAR